MYSTSSKLFLMALIDERFELCCGPVTTCKPTNVAVDHAICLSARPRNRRHVASVGLHDGLGLWSVLTGIAVVSALLLLPLRLRRE
jgi:hypothetical protein